MPHDLPTQLRFEPFDEAWLDSVTELVTDPDVLRFTRVPEPVPDGTDAGLWSRLCSNPDPPMSRIN